MELHLLAAELLFACFLGIKSFFLFVSPMAARLCVSTWARGKQAVGLFSGLQVRLLGRRADKRPHVRP